MEGSVSGAAIEVHDLAKSFAPRRGVIVEAIRSISLTVAAGEFLAIVGPSGCGKSTFLHLVAGLERRPAAPFVSAARSRRNWFGNIVSGWRFRIPRCCLGFRYRPTSRWRSSWRA